MSKYAKFTFYERTLDTLIKYMPELSGSKLKCLFAISRLTVGENLNQATISIDQLELLTGLSRKTVIKTLQELSNLCLIDIDKSSHRHKYGINREEIQKLSEVETTPGKIYESVATKLLRLEKLYFDDLDFPPGSKQIFDTWNKYLHKRLDIYNKTHLNYIQRLFGTYTVEQLIQIISNCVISEEWNNSVIRETDLDTFFVVDGGS